MAITLEEYEVFDEEYGDLIRKNFLDGLNGKIDRDEADRRKAGFLGEAFARLLSKRYFEFESYLTYEKCRNIEATYDDGSIWMEDVLKSASAFIEFCSTGKVTDDDGNEI